jgi:hypothetical protein
MLDRISVDESAHNRDGLVLHAWDEDKAVDVFISRKVMDLWVEPHGISAASRSLYRAEYNELGKRNIDSIARIVARKYDRSMSVDCERPYVEVLISDIVESDEAIDQSRLIRRLLPPEFRRVL